MKPRMLNERQVRWSLILGRYNMEILYRPGKQNIRADALSRREQDLPADANDDRLQKRFIQVLKPTASYYREEDEETTDIIAMSMRVRALPAITRSNNREDTRSQHDIENLWNQAVKNDQAYQDAREAVISQQGRFPVALQIKCSIAECKVEDQVLYYRDRKWVPNHEPLRTSIIEQIHTSVVTGHPGREVTYTIIARDFF